MRYSAVAVGLVLLVHSMLAVADNPFDKPETSLSYRQAKTALYAEYGQGETFYCGCGYADKQVDAQSCGLETRKNEQRAGRTEAEHVVPVSWWARTHQPRCWNEKICERRSGKRYKGRSCCGRVNEDFQVVEGDLHNLRLTVGELNADRSNFRYGEIAGEDRAYGPGCDFEVDFAADVAEPPPSIRGDVARVHFYMIGAYGIEVDPAYLQVLKKWHREDPVSAEEKAYNRWVKSIQGNTNPYVEQ